MISMEMIYWMFGAVIVMFNVIIIGLVMLGNTAEQNDGGELFISFWAVVLMAALVIYLFVFIAKPVLILLAQSVWYPF